MGARPASRPGDPRTNSEQRSARGASAIRWGSIATIGVCLVLLVRLLPVNAALRALSGWVEGAGFLGVFAFAGVYALATVLALPGLILTVSSGALFGLGWGTLAVSIGSTLGVAATFLIGRYLAREAVAKRLLRYPRFAAIDRAVGIGGWRIVALLRLSPLVPFNLQNYLYGLTAIRFWPCVLASWAAMLPGTFLYVYLGHAGRSGLEAAAGADSGRTAGEWALLAVGLVATAVVSVYVARLAKRAMEEQSGAAVQPSAETADANQRSGRVGLALPLAALALAGLTACAHQFGQRLAGLFGPPPVTLAESYEERPGGPGFDHSALDALLRKHVNAAGGVDYAALRADPAPLLAYNRSLAAAPFDELGRSEKLALLLNAYNAFTLELLVEWLPREGIEGIRDIPAAQRWDDVRWRIGAHTFSLTEIEHEQIRPRFIEPRIHWALVCAAVGCPPLRAEAYVAARLDGQLADQERRVHSEDSRWLRQGSEQGVIHLSVLYDWYGGDFEQVAGSVLEYVARHFAPLRADLAAGRVPRVAWLDYDWSLNDQENLP